MRELQAQTRDRWGAVLLAALEALESADEPGEMVHLPFRWHEPRAEAIKNANKNALRTLKECLSALM